MTLLFDFYWAPVIRFKGLGLAEFRGIPRVLVMTLKQLLSFIGYIASLF